MHLKTVTSKKPTKTPPQLYRGESAHIYHLTRANCIFWHSNIDIRILRGWLHYFIMFWEKIFFSDFHPIPTIRNWKNRFFRLAYLDQFLRYKVYFSSVNHSWSYLYVFQVSTISVYFEPPNEMPQNGKNPHFEILGRSWEKRETRGNCSTQQLFVSEFDADSEKLYLEFWKWFWAGPITDAFYFGATLWASQPRLRVIAATQ